MDQRIFHIINLLISASGVIGLAFKYQLPKADKMFWSDNPYSLKRKIVNSYRTGVFLGWALLGISIELSNNIFSFKLIAGNYRSIDYAILFLIGVILLYVIIYPLLSKLAYNLSKSRWIPLIIEKQSESFQRAKRILEHAGLDPENPLLTVTPEAVVQEKEKNYQVVDTEIKQIAELLDISIKEFNRTEVFEIIKPYFV